MGRAPPLQNAYAAAIRQATQQLQADYRRSVESRVATGTSDAFALVAVCADSVAGTEFPAAVAAVDQAQRALQTALAALLYGHDARQVAYLQRHLLRACAHSFQRHLVQEEAAWRAFHGLLLQALVANSGPHARATCSTPLAPQAADRPFQRPRQPHLTWAAARCASPTASKSCVKRSYPGCTPRRGSTLVRCILVDHRRYAVRVVSLMKQPRQVTVTGQWTSG